MFHVEQLCHAIDNLLPQVRAQQVISKENTTTSIFIVPISIGWPDRAANQYKTPLGVRQSNSRLPVPGRVSRNSRRVFRANPKHHMASPIQASRAPAKKTLEFSDRPRSHDIDQQIFGPDLLESL